MRPSTRKPRVARTSASSASSFAVSSSMCGSYHRAVRWVLFSIFALTYAGITARRVKFVPIGRPSVALVGACILVVLGAVAGPIGLGPDEALHAVEPHTIALLFG